MRIGRWATIVTILALALAVAVPQAWATVSIGADGVPTSNGLFDSAGSPAVGVTISQALGGRISVPATSACLIGVRATCSAETLTVRVIPSAFGSYSDTCQDSDSYSSGTVTPATCAFDSGTVTSASPGTATARITASGCSSWTAEWLKSDSHLYFVDRDATGVRNVAFLLYGNFKLDLPQPNPLGGDDWTLTGSLTGDGRGIDPLGGITAFTASWTLNGVVNTGSSCSNGETSDHAIISSMNGRATVVQP